MKFVGIIPARYASTRFPGKPLIEIQGKTMIQRVYEQAIKSKSLEKVVVATDSVDIERHVKDFGGEVVLTSTHHRSGTDRCFEALEKLGKDKWDAVINIQGDEPFIDPLQVDLLCSCFENPQTQIATLIKKLNSTKDLQSEHVIKVVSDKNGNALYFSRAAIPFYRGQSPENWISKHTYFKHIGIYGYRSSVLGKITQLPASTLEIAESLEQLRWLENGYKIQTAITDKESVSVDVPDDLKKLSAFL